MRTMFHTTLLWARRLTVALGLIVAGLTASLATVAQTTLYEVSKDDRRILIGGTIHLLHPDEFPLPREFESAYAEADVLYLEADLMAIQDPAFSQKMMQAMLYPPGKSLDTELSPEVWQKLQAYSETHQFPVQNFLAFDPAFVSMVMTVMAAQQKGITDGVDTHFMARAHRDGLPMGYLESPDAVLGYMKALAGQDGDNIMQATLAELEHFDDMMTRTVAAWRQGDLETLDQDLGTPMREEAPHMYATLLVERNADWLPQLERLFNDAALELVLVGSLHLAGADSLLKALEERGYRVQAYLGTDSSQP